MPTVAELVPGYEASTWCGVGVPQGHTDGDHRATQREINAGLADPDMKARLADLGGTVSAGTQRRRRSKAYIADESEKWAKVVKFAGIKPE